MSRLQLGWFVFSAKAQVQAEGTLTAGKIKIIDGRELQNVEKA